jgi:hypothetical protein
MCLRIHLVVVFLFPECIFGKDLLNNQQNFHSGSLTHEVRVIMGGKAMWKPWN